MEYEIKDFIGVFDNALDTGICEQVVNNYNYVYNITARIATPSRQILEGVPKVSKEDNTYFIHEEHNESLIVSNNQWMPSINNSIINCLNEYIASYDVLGRVPYALWHYRLQKTKIGGGYHVWHNEVDYRIFTNRLITVIVYLNNVVEGGETEFLYYHRRIKPVAGRIILFPGYYTHTHRGNPPISNDKYILTTWAEINR